MSNGRLIGLKPSLCIKDVKSDDALSSCFLTLLFLKVADLRVSLIASRTLFKPSSRPAPFFARSLLSLSTALPIRSDAGPSRRDKYEFNMY